MASRHKNIRIDDETMKIIWAFQVLENCDFSTAVKRLLHDGAKAPRPRPVLAQVACHKVVGDLLRMVTEWRRDFVQVHNRLAAYTATSSNPERDAKLQKWRDLADRCLSSFEKLEERLFAVVESATGLSSKEAEDLVKAKDFLHRNLADWRKKLAALAAQGKSDAQLQGVIAMHELILKSLCLLSA